MALRHLGKRRPDGPLGAFDSRLVTEYSAYLAEVAHSDIPFVVLTRLLGNAFNRTQGFRLYALAEVAVAERLCQDLGIEHADFIGREEVEQSALAAALSRLLELSAAELRLAARRIWESDFGGPLLRPVARAPA